MKNLMFVLFLCLSISSSAQVVSGLFSGTLVNDSTKKEQRYELALSEYRGKVRGYSYTTFILNDSFFYSIKRVTGVKKDGMLIVEDEKMLHNNFPRALTSRGVRQVNTIQLIDTDTMRTANGSWKTTKTKIYYSISGQAALHRTDDSAHSALINHLKELNIIGNSFNNPTVASSRSKSKTENNRPQNVSTVNPVATPIPHSERSNRVLHHLDVSSDSLVLSFYDNGVIDGDSISVYVNGQAVISQRKLTDKAVKQTVHFKANQEVRIVLVAESLGSLPPNTGLLIIEEGGQRHQLNFAADFTSNASIVLRRK